MVPQQVPSFEAIIETRPAASLPGTPWGRVAYRAVEEISDSEPALRRLSALAMIGGSLATWGAIGLAAAALLG